MSDTAKTPATEHQLTYLSDLCPTSTRIRHQRQLEFPKNRPDRRRPGGKFPASEASRMVSIYYTAPGNACFLSGRCVHGVQSAKWRLGARSRQVPPHLDCRRMHRIGLKAWKT